MPAGQPPYSSRGAFRMQRDAARAQEHYWRSLRRPSIVGPLILIALGVVAFLVETGKLSSLQLWDWYVRWWPLLLIAVGTVSLAEWWFDRASPYGRRHRYGGIVVLSILLALFGHASRGLHRFGIFNGYRNGDSLYRFFGEERSSEADLNREIPAAALLDIQVPRGNVTLTPSEDSRIHVQAREKVYADSDSEAHRAFAALEPQLSVSGTNVSLRVASQRNGWADLAIAIPRSVAASIAAGSGDVAINGVNTPVDVTAGQGDVKLMNLKAPAHVRMRNGDLIANSIAGDLSLEGKFEDVTISGVEGRALLDGDFFGDTHLSRVASQVHFHSSRTSIDLGGLPGGLSLDSGELAVTNPAGPVKIATRAKDIECTGLPQSADIQDVDGAISVSVAGQPGPMKIENRNGQINLALPGNAQFALLATARNGEIQSEFALPVSKAGPGQSVAGTVGGTPGGTPGNGVSRIELIADHGNIRIGKSAIASAGVLDRSQAEHGKAERGNPVRRLRLPPGGVPAAAAQ